VAYRARVAAAAARRQRPGWSTGAQRGPWVTSNPHTTATSFCGGSTSRSPTTDSLRRSRSGDGPLRTGARRAGRRRRRCVITPAGWSVRHRPGRFHESRPGTLDAPSAGRSPKPDRRILRSPIGLVDNMFEVENTWTWSKSHQVVDDIWRGSRDLPAAVSAKRYTRSRCGNSVILVEKTLQ